MLQLAELKDGWEKSLNGNLRCGTCFSCQNSGRSRLFAVVNVQAVVSPGIMVTSPCLRSIFKPWQACNTPAVTEEGPLGRSQGVGYNPEPPCTGSTLPLFADFWRLVLSFRPWKQRCCAGGTTCAEVITAKTASSPEALDCGERAIMTHHVLAKVVGLAKTKIPLSKEVVLFWSFICKLWGCFFLSFFKPFLFLPCWWVPQRGPGWARPSATFSVPKITKTWRQMGSWDLLPVASAWKQCCCCFKMTNGW